MPHTVAFTSTIYSDWGGCEYLWHGAANRLLDDGHRVAVNHPVCKARVGQLEQLVSRGVPVTYRRFRRPQRFFGPRVYQWLDKVRPDLLVITLAAHFQGSDWAAACRLRGIPYCLVVQSGDECAYPDDSLAASLREAYLNAVRCFFVAGRNIDFVEHQIAVRIQNAEVVRNPYNVPYAPELPWPTPLGTRFACVARLEPISKGHDLLFRVLATPKWRERDWQLTLYGDGNQRDTLRRLATMLELGDERVRFAGQVRDIRSVWAGQEVLILPSRFEGLPLALVEAMLCGRPAVVTDVSGNTEMVDDGVNGFVAAAPTVAALDEALDRAWSRRADWPAMGRQAARDARDRVPPDPARTFADRLLSLLDPARTPIPATHASRLEAPEPGPLVAVESR